jgi:hypothetical protein
MHTYEKAALGTFLLLQTAVAPFQELSDQAPHIIRFSEHPVTYVGWRDAQTCVRG